MKAIKTGVAVQVAFADADGVLQTLEGRMRYRSGDALLTGTQGERWPVPRNRFQKSYEPLPPTDMGQPGLYRKRPHAVTATQLDAPMQIRIPGRGVLRGRTGDWLIEDGNDRWIVAADVFARTYEPLTAPASNP